jgi:hypothetical protein
VHPENPLCFEELHAQLDSLEVVRLLGELRSPVCVSNTEPNVQSLPASLSELLTEEHQEHSLQFPSSSASAFQSASSSPTTLLSASSVPSSNTERLLPDPDAPIAFAVEPDFQSDSEDDLEAFDMSEEVSGVRSSSDKSEPPPA